MKRMFARVVCFADNLAREGGAVLPHEKRIVLFRYITTNDLLLFRRIDALQRYLLLTNIRRYLTYAYYS